MNLSRILLACLKALSALPYAWLRRLGNTAGWVLYVAARARCRIADVNLRLCFPEMSAIERAAIIRMHCQFFARSFLDRFVLWHQPAERIQRMVRLEDVHHFEAHVGKPLILLTPHFLGMDAGGTRLTIDHKMFAMFANQKNQVFNEAMRAGRARFSGATLLVRQDGLRGAIRKLRANIPFYFLPDMDLGARDSLFVPFFGVPAATVPSLARLVSLTGATVVPCVTQMTDEGYVMRFYPAWEDVEAVGADAITRRMNAFIEARVLEMLPQYLWTHKRFKTRPPGEPDPYRRGEKAPRAGIRGLSRWMTVVVGQGDADVPEGGHRVAPAVPPHVDGRDEGPAQAGEDAPLPDGHGPAVAWPTAAAESAARGAARASSMSSDRGGAA